MKPLISFSLSLFLLAGCEAVLTGDDPEVEAQSRMSLQNTNAQKTDEPIDWEKLFDKLSEIAEDAATCTEGGNSDASCDEAEKIEDQVTDALKDAAKDAGEEVLKDVVECYVPEWLSDHLSDGDSDAPDEGPQEDFTTFDWSGPSDFGLAGGSWSDVINNPGGARLGCTLISLGTTGQETFGDTTVAWCCDLYLAGEVNLDGSDFDLDAHLEGTVEIDGPAGSGFVSLGVSEDSQYLTFGINVGF